MNGPPIKVDLTPINLTAEMQKVVLHNQLTSQDHADLRLLILDAAAAIGMDGAGRDGLLGYLKFAASTFPKQYMALLSKVLPLQIDSRSTVNVIEHVSIVSVPPDKYMPPPTTSIPPTIEPMPGDAPSLQTEDPSSIQTIEDVLNNPTPVDISTLPTG